MNFLFFFNFVADICLLMYPIDRLNLVSMPFGMSGWCMNDKISNKYSGISKNNRNKDKKLFFFDIFPFSLSTTEASALQITVKLCLQTPKYSLFM